MIHQLALGSNHQLAVCLLFLSPDPKLASRSPQILAENSDRDWEARISPTVGCLARQPSPYRSEHPFQLEPKALRICPKRHRSLLWALSYVPLSDWNRLSTNLLFGAKHLESSLR